MFRLFSNKVKIREAEKEIAKKEGFNVKMTQTDGTLAREELDGVPRYSHWSKASGDLTVSEWIAVRFAPDYPGFGVKVFNGHGSSALGQTKLAEIRGSYRKEKKR